MKKMLLTLLVLILIGCGEETTINLDGWNPILYVDNIPIYTELSTYEIKVLSITHRTFNQEYPNIYLPAEILGVWFIRSLEDRIPTVCYNDDCTNIWIELPIIFDEQDIVPFGGYAGLSIQYSYVFINTMGGRAEYLVDIYVHELVHTIFNIAHGSTLKQIANHIEAIVNNALNNMGE